MSRREFSNRVKLEAHQRAKGCCEKCKSGVKLLVGDIFYDHIIPDGLGGEPELTNCQVLCKSHHDEKTRKTDVPAIAKTKRIQLREAGIKKSRRSIPGRKFNGTPIPARWIS